MYHWWSTLHQFIGNFCSINIEGLKGTETLKGHSLVIILAREYKSANTAPKNISEEQKNGCSILLHPFFVYYLTDR